MVKEIREEVQEGEKRERAREGGRVEAREGNKGIIKLFILQLNKVTVIEENWFVSPEQRG